jgi:hypothetical protein
MHPLIDFILLSSQFQFNNSHYGDLKEAKQLWAALQCKISHINGVMRRIEVSFSSTYQGEESHGTIKSFVAAFEIDHQFYSIRGAKGWNDIRGEYLDAEWIAHHRQWNTRKARWMGPPTPLVLDESGSSYATFQKSVAQWQASQLRNHTTPVNQEPLHTRL